MGENLWKTMTFDLFNKAGTTSGFMLAFSYLASLKVSSNISTSCACESTVALY